MDCPKDNNKLKIKALQRLSTLNPSSIPPAILIITAFIMNKNNPNVKRVKGKVNKTNTGFTKILKTPKVNATQMASIKESTVMPDKKLEISITNKAVIINRKKVFMVFFYRETQKYIIFNV